MTRRSQLPEYLMEEFGARPVHGLRRGVRHPLGPPRLPGARAVPDPLARRALMGLSAAVNIYSLWGKRSGVHFNPASTLTFWRLGKVSGRDAAFYALAQFAGAVLGVLVVTHALRSAYLEPPVLATATRPGPAGEMVAFVAEEALTFVLISVVLATTNSRRLAPYTGLVVGFLVAVYITVEDPLSGMSMNPARSFAPAVVGLAWGGLWVYFVAPQFGMLLAAQLYVWRKGRGRSVPEDAPRQPGPLHLLGVPGGP